MASVGINIKFSEDVECIEAPGGVYKKGQSYWVHKRNAVPFLNEKKATVSKAKKEKAVTE